MHYVSGCMMFCSAQVGYRLILSTYSTVNIRLIILVKAYLDLVPTVFKL